jgi:hypothetical protein
MKTGMLWFDNDPKTDLETKILKAVKYYHNKYGENPNLCFVHPSMLAQNHNIPNGVEIRSSAKVLPNHLWLGISNHIPLAAG